MIQERLLRKKISEKVKPSRYQSQNKILKKYVMNPYPNKASYNLKIQIKYRKLLSQ
jgi:hypothetical protein